MLVEAWASVRAARGCRRGRAGKCRAEIRRARRCWPGRWPAIPNRRRFLIFSFGIFLSYFETGWKHCPTHSVAGPAANRISSSCRRWPSRSRNIRRRRRAGAGGGVDFGNARLPAFCGYSFCLWRGIAASKFAANRIEVNPFILADWIFVRKSRRVNGFFEILLHVTLLTGKNG